MWTTKFCYNNLEHSTIGPHLFKWWQVSHQLCLQLGLQMGTSRRMQVRKCQWSHNLMKRGGTYGRRLGQSSKGTKMVQGFCKQVSTWNEFWTRDEVWLNIKKIWLPKGLSHKFLCPYVGPFKVLEKQIFNTYKLELLKTLKVNPIFHFLLLKLVTRDASRLNWEYTLGSPPNLIDNEHEFQVEVVFKSRQLKGWEREYLVKWKIYHLIKASWINELDMEHAQKTMEEFHNRRSKGNVLCDEDINSLLAGEEIA